MQNRFKSWVVWAAILGAVGVILNTTGAFEKMGITSDGFEASVNALGALLIALGVLNNPTSKDSF